MTHKIVFRPAALDDVADIEEWIGERSDHETATAYADRILAACEGLADYSDRGSKRGDVMLGARTIVFERSATISYVVGNGVVEIARILRRGRNIADLFNNG